MLFEDLNKWKQNTPGWAEKMLRDTFVPRLKADEKAKQTERTQKVAQERDLAKRTLVQEQQQLKATELERDECLALNRALQAEKDAIRAMMDNGLIPRAELGADGTWTLYDTGTGQEIGTANDWEGAGRLSVAHANFKEEEDADRIAMVFSAYQAAEVSRDWNQRTGRMQA